MVPSSVPVVPLLAIPGEDRAAESTLEQDLAALSRPGVPLVLNFGSCT